MNIELFVIYLLDDDFSFIYNVFYIEFKLSENSRKWKT